MARTSRSSRWFVAAGVAVAGYLMVLGDPQVATVVAGGSGDPVIAAAGDIACAPGSVVSTTHCQQAKTGSVLTSIDPVAVLPLGDTQYNDATATEYAGSYNKVSWGSRRASSRPVLGNHEYHTNGAAGYFDEFGSDAGSPSKGYYSYDLGAWHLIALNSECAKVGGCGAGSPQETWLRNDLAAHPAVCTLAYWHRPRFSSSKTTPSSTMFTPFWNDLYAAHADVVLNGHAHDYERFSPQTPSGQADADGPREFVVGTGGEDFQPMGSAIKNSRVRSNTSFGVLKMTLHATSYDWQFMPASGYHFTDSGSGACTK